MSNLTRTCDLVVDDEVVAQILWAWGICSIVTPAGARREPRLDTNNELAITHFIWAIQRLDPTVEFLWEDYDNAATIQYIDGDVA